MLARAHKAGANIGAVCDAIHARQGELGMRRIQGVLQLAKQYGSVASDEACAAALELRVAEYRFVRRYLERRPQAPLSLRQVDPLIRELTQYRDLGMRKLPLTAAEELLEIIMRRYERASTLLTSNRPVDDWGKLLGDSAAVTAMLDRLLHHGHVLKCGPRSWRTKTGSTGDAQ